MKINSIFCDMCNSDIKKDFDWYLRAEVYMSKYDSRTIPESLKNPLDFCSLKCMKEWVNKHG